jgi:glucosamine--fructose-6-phosphate aminotransferase (isomerizing)
MNDRGQFTHHEILSQPEAWAAALNLLAGQRRAILDLEAVSRFDQILFTGCGSTYYLSLAAAALTQELTGCSCRAFPASELWFYPQSSYVGRIANPTYQISRTGNPIFQIGRTRKPIYQISRSASPTDKTLLVAISRSGETTETLRACEAFLADKRGALVTLSCYGDMPLAKMGSLNLVFPSGQERSVAQTRAFSTLYLSSVALACLWAGREDIFDSLARLPEAGRRLLNNYASLAADLGRDAALDRFYWLGSGPRYGLACELSLKMKEMSLSHSEPFHFMEFRHGPKSMATSNALVIGLRSSVDEEHESAVLADVQALRGQTLTIGESKSEVEFRSGLAEAACNVLYLPVGQLIAFERSLSKSLNPDQPNNLDSVVKL